MTCFFFLNLCVCSFLFTKAVHHSCTMFLKHTLRGRVMFWSCLAFTFFFKNNLPHYCLARSSVFKKESPGPWEVPKRRLSSSSSFLQKLSIKGGMLYVHGALCSFHAMLSGCPASRDRSKTKHPSRLGVPPNGLFGQKLVWYLKLSDGRWKQGCNRMHQDLEGCRRT